MDCVNKDGILLQVVQVLTDLNLFIRKAYITSDGSWFMDGKYQIEIIGNRTSIDFFLIFVCLIVYSVLGVWFSVFNVTDRDGNKVLDKEVISYMKKVFVVCPLYSF